MKIHDGLLPGLRKLARQRETGTARVVCGIGCPSTAHLVNENGPCCGTGLVGAFDLLRQGFGDLRLVEGVSLLPRMQIEAHRLAGADTGEAVPQPALNESIDRGKQ